MSLRKTILALCILSVITLSACSKSNAGRDGAQSNQTAVSSDWMSGIVLGGEAVKAEYFNGNCGVIRGLNGYFEWDDYARLVRYYDETSSELMYLCAKPDCTHVDDDGYGLTTCNAYIGDIMELMSWSLYYYDKMIYYISYNKDTYVATLCRMSIDGSKREAVTELVGEYAECGSYIYYLISDDYVYYTYNADTDNYNAVREAEVVRYNLTNGSTEVLYGVNDTGAMISKVIKYGNCIYFREVVKDTATQEDIIKCKAVNISGGEAFTIVESGNFTITDDGKLLYWKDGEGLRSKNLYNGEDVLLVANETEPKCQVATDGEYIYIDNQYNAVYNDAQHCVRIFDMSGSEIGKMDMRTGQMALYVSDGRIYAEGYPINHYIDVDDVRSGDVDWK
jgi:hypothetical protein